MRRADRIFETIQVLRRAYGPLSAARLAAEPGTSKRIVDRDSHALVVPRVPIRGEAGMGSAPDRSSDLPPPMLAADEVEAAALGA